MSYSEIINFRFEFYSDIRFWISFLAVFLLFRTLSINRKIRNISLGIFNIVFLLALPRFTPKTFIFLLCVALLTYVAGYSLNRRKNIGNGINRLWFAALCIGFLVIVLSFFKYSFIQETFFRNILKHPYEASDFIFVIGISYSSFKMIHFLIESYNRQISSLSLPYYLNFIFFFPAFISGPIMRYNGFVDQLDAEKTCALSEDLRSGTERIVHGLFKKYVLSMVVYKYSLLNIPEPIIDASAGTIILGLYAYTLYVYFDFAGYSDMAIGCARILGYKLPENFNNPFMRRNIQELWANWHMSLTRWLTDYIYWPLSRRLRRIEYFRKSPILLSNTSIIVTFIICGMWHGPTLNFVIWGLYHGIGLAFLNIYRKQKRKIRNRYLLIYFQSRVSKVVGVLATFTFFVTGILLFALRLDTIGILIKRLLNIY